MVAVYAMAMRFGKRQSILPALFCHDPCGPIGCRDTSPVVVHLGFRGRRSAGAGFPLTILGAARTRARAGEVGARSYINGP